MEQAIVRATASASGQLPVIKPIDENPILIPSIYIHMISLRLFILSERIPPSGLATRLTKAKDDAIIPAFVGVRVKVLSKKAGSIETTASSAPKLQK